MIDASFKRTKTTRPSSLPDCFFSSSISARKSFLLLGMSQWQINTLRQLHPGVHKQENIIIPKNIEYFLSLNLKYIFPTKMGVSLPLESFDEAIRKIRIAWMHRNHDKKEKLEYLQLKKFKFEPEKANDVIEGALAAGRSSLLSAMEKNIPMVGKNSMKQEGWVLPSLSCDRKTLLGWLSDNKVMALISDKNLGITLVTVEWYRKQIFLFLKTGYEKLSSTPWDSLAEQIFCLVQKESWMNDQVVAFLQEVPNFEHVPTFHGIPKIHKTPWKLRPIVPQHSFCSRNIAMVLHVLLQPLRSLFPWIVQSSRKFIQNLSAYTKTHDITIEHHIIGIDVVSMYTNILTHHLLEAIERILDEKTDYPLACKLWMLKSIQFLNDNVFFQFDGEIFRQTSGIAMGTATGPCLADLFMAIWEERLGINTIGFYNRYIDDSFLLTTLPVSKIEKMFLIPGLSFTFQTDPEQSFLDSFIHRHGSEVCWKPFAKRLNHYQYLPWVSSHPLSVKKGLVKTELIRYSSLSKKEDYYVERVRFFYDCLRLRGYPEKVLNAWIKQVKYDRNQGFERPLAASESVLLVPSEYNTIWDHIGLQEHWDKVIAYLEFRNYSREGFEVPKRLIKSLSRTTSLWDVARILNKDLLRKASKNTTSVFTSERMEIAFR